MRQWGCILCFWCRDVYSLPHGRHSSHRQQLLCYQTTTMNINIGVCYILSDLQTSMREALFYLMDRWKLVLCVLKKTECRRSRLTFFFQRPKRKHLRAKAVYRLYRLYNIRTASEDTSRSPSIRLVSLISAMPPPPVISMRSRPWTSAAAMA